MGMFRGAGDSVIKCILNLLKAFNLHERKSMVERVTIIITRVNKGSSGGGKVKSVTYTMEVTNLVVAGARKGGNSLEKDKLESRMNPRFLAEEVKGMGCMEGKESNGLMILKVR